MFKFKLLKKHKSALKEILEEFISPDNLSTQQMLKLVQCYLQDQLDQFQKQFEILYQTNRFDLSSKLRLEILIQELNELNKHNKHKTLQIFKTYMDEAKEKVVEPIESKPIQYVKPIINQSQYSKDFKEEKENTQQIFFDMESDANGSNIQQNQIDESLSDCSSNEAKNINQTQRVNKKKKKQKNKKQYVLKSQKKVTGICDLLIKNNDSVKKSKILFIISLPQKLKAILKVANQEVQSKHKIQEINCYIYTIERSLLNTARLHTYQDGMFLKNNESTMFVKDLIGPNQDSYIYIKYLYQISVEMRKSQLIRIFVRLCDLRKRKQGTNQDTFLETIKDIANIYKSYGYTNNFQMVNLQPLMRQLDFYTIKYSMLFWYQVFSQKCQEIIFAKNIISYNTHRNITYNFRDEVNIYRSNKLFREFYAFLCRIQLYAHLRDNYYNFYQAQTIFLEIMNIPQTPQFQFLRVICFTRPGFLDQVNDFILNKIQDEQNQKNINAVQYFILQMYNLNNKFFYQNQISFQTKSYFISLKIIAITRFIQKTGFKNYKQNAESRQSYRELFNRHIQDIHHVFFSNGNIRSSEFVVSKANYLEIYKAYKKHLFKYEQINDYFQKYLISFFIEMFSDEKINLVDLISVASLGQQKKEEMLLVEQIIAKIKIDEFMLTKIVLLFNQADCDSFRIIDILKMYYGMRLHLQQFAQMNILQLLGKIDSKNNQSSYLKKIRAFLQIMHLEYNDKIKQKKSAIYHLKVALKSKDKQIQQIYVEIVVKQIILQLKDKKKIELQIYHELSQKIPETVQLQPNQKHLYFSTVYQSRIFKYGLNDNLIFKLMLDSPFRLVYERDYYEDNLKKCLHKIEKTLQERYILYEQLVKLRENRKIISETIGQYFKFETILQSIQEQLKCFEQKSNILKNIMFPYKQFAKYLGQLNFKQKLQSLKLSQALTPDPELAQLYGIAIKVNYISKTKYWLCKAQMNNPVDLDNVIIQEGITNIKDFSRVYQKSINELRKQINNYIEYDMKLQQFTEKFVEQDGIIKVLQVCLEKNEKKLLDIMVETISKIDQKYFKKLLSFMKTVNQFLELYGYSKRVNYIRILQKVELIGKQPQQSTKQILDDIRQLQAQLQIFLLQKQQNKLDQLINQNHIYKLIELTNKNHELFQFYVHQKINKQAIQELIEYIDDIEGTSLGLDVIRQFQRVVEYFLIIQKNKNINGLIRQLKQNIQSVKNISVCLDSCYSLRYQLQQLVWKAKNRQLSFKCQIEQIFKGSVFSCRCYPQIRIQIFLYRNRLANKQQKVSITYKEMSLFKQKSLLIIRDMKKIQKQNNKNVHETIQLLQKFEEFFQVVEKIHKSLVNLDNYGYNVQQFTYKQKIQGSSYVNISKISTDLQKQQKDWILFIKQIYSHSYLLTHFIGPKLNNFIKQNQKDQYLPAFTRILKLDKKKFSITCKLQLSYRQNIQKFRETNHYYKKVKHLAEAFENVNMNENIMQQKNKIIIIKCNPCDSYAVMLSPRQLNKEKIYEFAESTQVLFCQEATSSQEIQIFMFRALIYWSKKHYIITCHNLSQDVKIFFTDLLIDLNKNRKSDFERAQLCFVVNTYDKITGLLTRPRQFNHERKEVFQKQSKELTKQLSKHLAKTIVVESLRAGLGKTFRVQQQAKKKLLYFPICGNIKFQNLSVRLKKILESNEEFSLLIQIGHVENKQKLQVFLAQMVLFRSFYYQEYIFLPSQTQIFIQIENIFQPLQKKQNKKVYHIIQMLKNQKQVINIQKFDIQELVFDQKNLQDKFTLIYLDLLRTDKILTKNLSYKYNYEGNQKDFKVPNVQKSRNNIKLFFVDWFIHKRQEPTFLIYKCFMKMLFNAFKAFSDSPHLHKQQFQDLPEFYKVMRLQEVRREFLNICIENILQFLEESVTTNDFSDNKNREHLRRFQDKLQNVPLLIIPNAEYQGYQFVYLDDKNVNIAIKSLLIKSSAELNNKLRRISDENTIHELFHETALNSLQDQLIFKLCDIMYHISNNKKFQTNFTRSNNMILSQLYEKIPRLKFYKITIDNFYKMCLIILRAFSGVPSIIMGESGVGKTALIEFLVNQIFQDKLLVYNVHAGIHQKEISDWIDEIKTNYQQLNSKQQLDNKQKRLWVFFDEFNTSDELSYFKQIIIDRRFMGVKLAENIIFLAACNPYRQQKQRKINSGLALPSKQNQTKQLAFKVKPPCLSMIQIMWDYQQLKRQEIKQYVESMIEEVQFSNKKRLIDIIVQAHEYFKDNIQISSVSLRDVSRFRQLYNWFLIYMPAKEQQKRKSHLQLQKRQNDINNYDLVRDDRAVILSFCFCYSLRIENRVHRKDFLNMMQKPLKIQKDYMITVLQNQQIDYINRLKYSEQKIACNNALMQNLFSTLICLINKIPILIIGNPGSSKSISIKMLDSNLKGNESQSQFCKNLPAINLLNFQGSESSTSEGIQKIYQKAQMKIRQQKQHKYSKKSEVIQCILFDEIGLAQKSVHNPLKVLHSKLQTHKKDLGFIGISNYELDAAKMSRFLVLAHSNPDKNEIRDTAVKIYRSYFPDQPKYQQKFKKLGEHYFNFIQKWNSNQENRHNFFGLRDFYSYIKYICLEMKKEDFQLSAIQKIILKSIQINFDGQPNSVQFFCKIAQIKEEIQSINPIEMVVNNLSNVESRCLMLIIKNQALIPMINQSIVVKGEKRDVVCIYGSTFQADKESEEYNLQVTSKIISYVSRGTILVFKDINNSIQTSLYDLFNKSFSYRNSIKTCRIAVGANSNPKCTVHQNFNAIVYVQEEMVKNLDLPFINRLQKHELNIIKMIDAQDFKILQQIEDWMTRIIGKKQDIKLKNHNFIFNSSKQALVTLIFKHKQAKNIALQVKKDLLKNRTTDFIINLRQKSKEIQLQVQNLIQEIIPFSQNKTDMIIYTYDQFSNAYEENQHANENYIIRLGELKSQKDLRAELASVLNEQRYNRIQIFMNYEQQYMHLNYLLFVTRQIKAQFQVQKQIVIIIQLHRFTFIKEKNQIFNISYLHKYQQYFVEDISKNTNLSEILELQTFEELYNKMNLQQKLSIFHLQALKLIRIKSEKPQSYQFVMDSFQVAAEMFSHNQYYKQQIKALVAKNLKHVRIDLNQIQSVNEIVLYSSNTHQALQKYISNFVQEIIVRFLMHIITEGLLIKPQEVYVLLNKKDHLPRIKQFLPLLSEIYVDLFNQKCNNLQKKSMNQRVDKIIRLVQNNQVKLPIFLSIFPQSFKDFTLIFRLGSQISVESMLQEIKFKVYSQEENREIQNKFEGMKAKLINIKLRNIKISQENQRQYRICQNAYFYDCFMFYLELLKLNLHPTQEIELFQFFNSLLEKLQFMIQEKIIFLVSNRIFFQNLCSILVPLFKQINSAKFIDKVIVDIPQDELIINILITIAQKCLLQACQLIKLQRASLSSFNQDVTAFIKFIRVIYRKMKLLGKNFSQIEKFQIDCKYDTTYKFIQFLNTLKKHKEGNEEQKLLKFFLGTSDGEEKSLNFKIFKFIESFLRKQSDQMINSEIIDYLSLFVWPEWYQKIEKHPQERQEGIRSFIDLSVKYSLFANNSTIFFSCLLQQLQNQSFKQIYQIMKSYDKDKDYLHLQLSDLNFKNNFSIAFGNYLQTLFLRLQIQIQDSQLLIEQQQFFIQLCSKKQLKNNCQGLFILQFLKFYGKCYIIELQKGQKIDLLLSMDEALGTQNLQTKHLRMFLLKEIYQKEKDFAIIKNQYIRKNKCRWINLLKDYIQQKKIELFLPPLLDDSDQKYLIMLRQLQQNKFQNIQLYHEVIRIALHNRNPWDTYQLLNFFMLNFYRRRIPQQTINLLKSQLDGRWDLQNQQFTLIYRLLKGYLMHNVAQLFIYNEDDFKQQIVFLNYFNLIVAGRTLNIPLNNMFFNQKGVVPKQYSKWLHQRYLIGTIHNPAAKRLEFILERHRLNLQGNSYTICSNVCDYISPVGGTFYGKNDGCAHPLNNATCPFCGGVLGAHAYNILTNADKGARVIDPKDVEKQLARINQKKEIEVLYNQNKINLSFVGYQHNTSIKNLQQYAEMIKQFDGICCDRMRQTGDMISYKLLQMLINVTWYFLAQLQMIETEEIQNIWGKTKRQTKEFLYEAIMFYYGDLRECLKIESKDDLIVWNLGISSKLSQFYLLCDSKKIDCELRNVQARDFFELEFQNIFSVYYQKEKQALINQSRNFEQKDKTDIIKEIGSYQQHQVQFQYISMFKIVKNNPCYEDMKINYKNTIIKSYPVLAYMIQNDDIAQKLYNYKKIFIYLSALQELFDGKIKRSQSQKGLKGILHFTENSNKLCENLPQFVNCWNKLAKDKFELKIDCHSEKVLGNLPQITEDSTLRMFLMDKKTTNNQHAQRLLAFVQIASRQYNERAQTLERLIVTSYPYYNDLQIFSTIPLNPTHVLNSQSQLVEFPIKRIIELVDIYSSQSVKYGESKPHYSLQNIQRVLIKEFIGCKYLITQKEKFRYITYVGQRSHFISQLRYRQDQRTLEQVGLKEKIQKYFNFLQIHSRASFEKEIKHIQGSLEQIIAFYMNIRDKELSSKQTIYDFIAKYQMKGIASCFKENPLDHIQNSCLADLYQFVQNYSFEGVQQLVDPIYKAALDERQKQNTKRLIVKLKNSDGKSFPIYYDFKIALYRFTGRILTLSLFNQNNKLSDYLCEQSYWPKNSQNDEALRELSKHLDNMTLSKVGSLIKEVPFKDKNQVKVQPKQQVENITAPQMQQKKNKAIVKKKIGQNYS